MALEQLLFGALPLLGIFDSLAQMISDLGFTFQIMIFSYMTFWLYMNLRESQVLFGLGVIIAAFFVFIQPILTNIFVVLFFVFIAMGNHLQFLIQFGLFPLMRFFGVELEHPEMAEQQKMHGIEQKMRQGLDLQKEEEEYLEKVQKREQQYQRKMQDRMTRQFT
ncbi:MAG: hypothetical protein ABIG96_06575 [Candidatus Micrarchaeota archaeon]